MLNLKTLSHTNLGPAILEQSTKLKEYQKLRIQAAVTCSALQQSAVATNIVTAFCLRSNDQIDRLCHAQVCSNTRTVILPNFSSDNIGLISVRLPSQFTTLLLNPRGHFIDHHVNSIVLPSSAIFASPTSILSENKLSDSQQIFFPKKKKLQICLKK